MKKSLIITALATAFVAGPAIAADLPVKAPAYVAPAPAFSWTGCYIGVHAGAGALHDSWTGEHGNGGLAGGQVGCNYQTGVLVFGVEAEGFWSGMKASYNDGPSLDSIYNTKNKYDFDIAARFGVAYERALIYGKAGWVWGKFDFDYSPTNFAYTDTGSATLNGLLIGVGLEYAFTNHWTGKFEYDYLNFGSSNVNFTRCATSCTANLYYNSVSADKHIFKLGANYKF